MRRPVVAAFTLAFAALCGASAATAADAAKHKFRIGFTIASGTGGFTDEARTESFFGSTIGTTTGDGGVSTGFRLGYEYRPTSRLGVSWNFETVSIDLSISERILVDSFDFFTGTRTLDTVVGRSEGSLRMNPITVGLNVYVSSGPRHELYVGPVAGYVLYDRLRQDAWTGIRLSTGSAVPGESANSIELDDGVALGAQAGLDLVLGSNAPSFHVSLGYLAMSTEAADGSPELESDVDPLLARFGVVFRF